LCVAYWLICRGLFLVAGQSYLAGLLFAMPLTAWAVRVASRRKAFTWIDVVLVMLAFTVFFWTSAVVLWWKNS